MSEHIDLGGFLRARREALQPADVGLRDSGRRRTPGLRREEVAALAGVSIDYLVRLEQGRDTKPSAAVLSALSDALQLNEDEHRHLAMLAAISSSPEMCPSSLAAGERAVPDTVRTPRGGSGPHAGLRAGAVGRRARRPTSRGRRWPGRSGLDGDPPNLARFTFLDPRGVPSTPTGTRWPTSRSTSCARRMSAGDAIR